MTQEYGANYTITPEQFVAFRKLHMARLMPVIIAILVGVALAVAMLVRQDDSIASAGATLLVLIVSYGLIVLLTWMVLLPWHARRVYNSHTLLHSELHFTAKETGFQIEHESGNTVIKWPQLYKWDERRGIMAFYVSKDLAYIVPEAALGDDGTAFVKSRLDDAGFTKAGKARK